MAAIGFGYMGHGMTPVIISTAVQPTLWVGPEQRRASSAQRALLNTVCAAGKSSPLAYRWGAAAAAKILSEKVGARAHLLLLSDRRAALYILRGKLLRRWPNVCAEA